MYSYGKKSLGFETRLLIRILHAHDLSHLILWSKRYSMSRFLMRMFRHKMGESLLRKASRLCGRAQFGFSQTFSKWQADWGTDPLRPHSPLQGFRYTGPNCLSPGGIHSAGPPSSK